MAELKQPISWKEIFGQIRLKVFNTAGVPVEVLAENDGTVRSQLILKDPDTGVQIAAAADDSGSEKGALHIKLAGAGETKKVDAQEESLGWLRVIAFHLAELRGGSEHITPENLKEYM